MSIRSCRITVRHNNNVVLIPTNIVYSVNNVLIRWIEFYIISLDMRGSTVFSDRCSLPNSIRNSVVSKRISDKLRGCSWWSRMTVTVKRQRGFRGDRDFGGLYLIYKDAIDVKNISWKRWGRWNSRIIYFEDEILIY